MCGATLSAATKCPACGEMVPKRNAGVKRVFLGLPVFEALFIAVFFAMVCGVAVLPLANWIKSIFRP